MAFVETHISDHVATVRLCRGKVNALTDDMVKEVSETFTAQDKDPGTRAVVLTGTGAFFSFGFDIPYFLSYSESEFTHYLEQFAALYALVFGFSKPVVAALNGHATAGGCMLALACDRRLMISASAKISLNEIDLGASVFAGSVEMLRFWVGGKIAQKVLCSGEMYTAEDALALGLIDRVCPMETLAEEAQREARQLAQKPQQAFGEIKSLLRGPTLEAMAAREAESIRRFVKIWYSPETWKKLEKIIIRK